MTTTSRSSVWSGKLSRHCNWRNDGEPCKNGLGNKIARGYHMKVGFIGLGTMGQPMALNLCRAGHPLTVWNRSPHKCVPLSDAGATIADDVADVFRRSDVVFLMLIDSAAIDHVLRRGTPSFAAQLSGRTVVNMSSVEPK